MIVLVSGATATMRRMPPANLGVFFNPRSTGNYCGQVVPMDMPWAADNAAYSGFNADAFLRMLDTLFVRQISGCLFIVAPDVVADSAATLRRFEHWRPILQAYGWPIAFVAQDGLTVQTAPWDDFAVLFIGGSTRWKLGAEAYTLCAYAKAIGKRVHVGRVNSLARVEMFSDVADTIDGTATSMYGDVFIPKMVAAVQRPPTRRILQRELL